MQKTSTFPDFAVRTEGSCVICRLVCRSLSTVSEALDSTKLPRLSDGFEYRDGRIYCPEHIPA